MTAGDGQTSEFARFRSGTVVRYDPDPSRHDPRWCREGVAVADDRGFLADTYWSTGNEHHIVTATEMPTVKILFYLDDYEELDRWRPDRAKWLTYAPSDRGRIPSQHGLQERLFVRRGAEPDLPTQVQNASDALDAASEELSTAQWRRDQAETNLRELQAALDARNTPVVRGGDQ